MHLIAKTWKNTKVYFAAISALVMLFFISFVAISQNHATYNIDRYLNYIGKVAIICLVMHAVISCLVYTFSEKQHILKNFEKITSYYAYPLGIGLFGAGVGSFALLATKKIQWVELSGCLLVWGFFLNLYSIVSYRLIKRVLQTPEEPYSP